VRAFRVYESDGLAHGNGEFAGRENEIGEVNSSVRLALGMDIYYSQAHRNGEYELN
jgi:hypothetical protein